tara:strand:- start:490 stop:849 length:360 start_codon:yes stop_codon:yes gene_type:complete
MNLLTSEQRRAMLANGTANAARIADDGNTVDHEPVVKLLCPWGSGTWLLSELDPEEPDTAFGLCDLGVGCPELGSVSLAELASVRGPGGLGIERDRHFTAKKPLSAYATEARQAGGIVA